MVILKKLAGPSPPFAISLRTTVYVMLMGYFSFILLFTLSQTPAFELVVKTATTTSLI